MLQESHFLRRARSSIFQFWTFALATIIFIVDSKTDLEIAVAVFYVAVVLMSLRFCQPRGVLLVSGGCIALTLASFLLTSTGASQSGLINCAISLSAIVAATYLGLEIKSVEVAALRAQAQLAHVARLTTLGELTASIAHEVNQPLAAITTSGNACLHWLNGQTPNLDKAKQSIERIVRDANRASELVNRVRNLAKKNPLEIERINLNDIVWEMVALIHNEIAQNHISLRTQLADDLSIVLGDRVQLQQVLLNLILNAIDAINAAKESPREVTIRSTNYTDGGVQIAVLDSGVGLEHKNTDHIFDAFYTTKSNGMGIGLAISHSIIQAHGGQIWATANNPRGAALQFILPGHQDKT